MSKPAKQKPFATEVALCSAFIAALPEGWTAFAETAGWDILMVRAADGFQVGVQAKLRLTPEVFSQAMEGPHDTDGAGPDCRAVLVPWDEAQRGIACFSPHVAVTIIRMPDPNSTWCRGGRRALFDPALPDGKSWHEDRTWHEMAPARRHQLPEYVPDVAAGASAPLQLTEWKIKAIKIAVLLEERGFVTRRDFSHLRLDHRRWIAPTPGWLRVEDGRFVAAGMPDFRAQHPVVFGKIAADAHKWRPPELPLPPPVQRALL